MGHMINRNVGELLPHSMFEVKSFKAIPPKQKHIVGTELIETELSECVLH